MMFLSTLISRNAHMFLFFDKNVQPEAPLVITACFYVFISNICKITCSFTDPLTNIFTFFDKKIKKYKIIIKIIVIVSYNNIHRGFYQVIKTYLCQQKKTVFISINKKVPYPDFSIFLIHFCYICNFLQMQSCYYILNSFCSNQSYLYSLPQTIGPRNKLSSFKIDKVVI